MTITQILMQFHIKTVLQLKNKQITPISVSYLYDLVTCKHKAKDNAKDTNNKVNFVL